MGTKDKVWLRDPVAKNRWLFKFNRINKHTEVYAGEDWSEKIASEFAEVLGIPHAEVELAERNNKPGVISRNFIVDRRLQTLVHGNDLLVKIWPNYPTEQRWGVSLHTIANVLKLLSVDVIHPGGSNLPHGIDSASDVFVAYLMLDALIGNTDRHHENWAIIVDQQGASGAIRAEIAPTFDHASSLSRELTDENRQMGFSGEKTSFSVKEYCARGKSAFYRTEEDKNPLSPIGAFKLAAQTHTTAARTWLKRLADVSGAQLGEVVQRVPLERMSKLAKDYVLRMVELNRKTLVESEI